MNETVITSLILAAISGITFLAYKHPEGYSKLYWPISIGTMFALCVYMSFYTGATHALIDTTFLLKEGSDTEFKKIKEMYDANGMFLIYFIIFEVYLGFLSYLPHLIGSNDPKNTDDEKD